jgi:hypothetical protein
MKAVQRQFLIICRVGDRSLHAHWLAGANRNFDVYLSYFGDEPNKYQNDCEFYDMTKGPKWPILAKIIADNPDLLSAYSAVWLPDDDLLIDTDSINRMFNLFAGLQLDLAQPALSVDSHVIYKELIVRNNSLVRYVNFVEVMAPIFSQKCLQAIKHTFSQSVSGWGLDNLWPVLLDYKNMAVIDATPIVHTRPLGGELYKNNPMSPQNDIQKVADIYPHLNISPDHEPNRFRVFASLKPSFRSKGLARLTAKLHKKLNKASYKNTTRYGEG